MLGILSEIGAFQQLRPGQLQFALRLDDGGFRHSLGGGKSREGPKDGEAVSSDLRPFLEGVYSAVLAVPTNLPVLKDSLTGLLEYLSGVGRTNANCWAADLFFCLSEGWERDWTEQNLPDDFHDVLS